MRRALILAVLALGALASCGPPQPLTAARARELCRDEARAADGITGTVRVGGGSEGPSAGGNLTITSAILNPVSEADALEACIERRLAGRPAPRQSGLTVAISGGT